MLAPALQAFTGALQLDTVHPAHKISQLATLRYLTKHAPAGVDTLPMILTKLVYWTATTSITPAEPRMKLIAIARQVIHGIKLSKLVIARDSLLARKQGSESVQLSEE